MPASEFKKKRWMEEADTLNIKFGFSLLIKFSPLYCISKRTYHLLNLRGILQQKPMKIMTSLLWYILWPFCAWLNIYVTHRGQLKCLVMFSFWWNVTSNWAQMLIIVILLCYVCCFQTGWHCFQTWLVFRSKNRSLNAWIQFKNWKYSFANQCSHDVYVYKHRTVL